jgi:hypothetical protein
MSKQDLTDTMDFSGFNKRKPLGEILKIPPRVQSVYSLTQHVWNGESDSERKESKKHNRVRLDTLEEFFIDPVRGYLHRILEHVADGQGQGFWLQAEFGVGKSHLMAATAVLAVGQKSAWEKLKEREDEEGKAGPAARLDTIWRAKLEKKKIFPIVFSLEGCGGGHDKKLEDFVLDEAQTTFALRLDKPLAVYPEEHLVVVFQNEHRKNLETDLRKFVADTRLMKGLPSYDFEELMDACDDPSQRKDAGRLLSAFYRHKKLTPNIPTERGERLRHAFQDILSAGYDGIFIAIDEMSEYLRRSAFTSEDEDCLLALSSTLAKAEGKPIWTLVAAQAAHTNPKKIVGPDRMREELLEHKAERFRDIVIQRTRKITDAKAVEVYYKGFGAVLPWVKSAPKEEFEACFPFTPDSLDILRKISTKLTGTRSTIGFLHSALKKAIEKKESDLVPLWKVFDDLMSYNETPSNSASGTISIKSGFRNQVAALEAAQSTLKRIADGQLARPQNKTRSERILNTLFLYHIAGVAALTRDQILDAVCDIKVGDETLEAQRGHYDTILEEMCGKLRNQVRRREGRFEFIPKETTALDDLIFDAADRLKRDPVLFRQMVDRLLTYSDPLDQTCKSHFADYTAAEDWQRVSYTVKGWHGQERSGKVTVADLHKGPVTNVEVEGEDDFLIVLSRATLAEKDLNKALGKAEKALDPRVIIWSPGEMDEAEKLTIASVAAYLLVATENRDTQLGKDCIKEFRKDGHRVFTVLFNLYARGAAKTSRTTLDISTVKGIEGALSHLAAGAMDTCYESRKVDFGSRKFDATGAVKLINGLVRLGQAVSEGDQLWAAVENFALPLGLVRRDAPKLLDPDSNRHYKAIRDRVLKHGQTGLEVRTIYNWFTGYHAEDGIESPGLTRRMVDIYLLCLSRKGIIRITQRHGGFIDRNTIAAIDFKPETLRNLDRVDLPRPLDDWSIFYAYLEALLSRRPGSLGPVPVDSLGPIFDRAKADESLKVLYNNHWIQKDAIENLDAPLQELFTELSQANPFTDLLVYWLDFAEEQRPEVYSDDEVYNAVRRGALRVAKVTAPDELTDAHLQTFRANFASLAELRESSSKTSGILVRAARLASAPVPDHSAFKEIAKAQKDVRTELEKANELVLKPDRVNTRLLPRLEKLEGLYVPAYVDALLELDSAQTDVETAARDAAESPALAALADFAHDLDEAKRSRDGLADQLAAIPPRLRLTPEDRDAAAKEVKQTSHVRDKARSPLLLPRILSEHGIRAKVTSQIKVAPSIALLDFASFLKSPGVTAAILKASKPSADLETVKNTISPDAVAKALVAMSTDARKRLAKEIKALLGAKTQIVVRLSEFSPATRTVFEKSDTNTVAQELKQFLDSKWKEGTYLKIEP